MLDRFFSSIHFTTVSIIFISLNCSAIANIEVLEKKLLEQSLEIQALEKQVEAKTAIQKASISGYLPTMNAVGGWGQNKTDELAATQKGNLGYVEGKLNLFRGLKDQATSEQRSSDLQIAQIDLESKKRELRLRLSELSGDMILLHKIQHVLEEEYQMTQNQKQMAAKKVAAGLTGEVDNLEFSLRESEIQIERKINEQRHLEAHEKLQSLFKDQISDADFDALEFSNPRDTLEMIAALNKVQPENSLEYKRASLTQQRLNSEKKEVRSDFLPSLDFTYSVGRLTPSEDNSNKFNESKYLLLLSIPLFSGFDTHFKSRSANLQSLAAEKHLQQTTSEKFGEIRILKGKLNEQIQLLELNEKREKLAQRYFELTFSEYKRGIKNSPDLVGATERWFAIKKKKFEILQEIENLKLKALTLS